MGNLKEAVKVWQDTKTPEELAEIERRHKEWEASVKQDGARLDPDTSRLIVALGMGLEDPGDVTEVELPGIGPVRVRSVIDGDTELAVSRLASLKGDDPALVAERVGIICDAMAKLCLDAPWSDAGTWHELHRMTGSEKLARVLNIVMAPFLDRVKAMQSFRSDGAGPGNLGSGQGGG